MLISAETHSPEETGNLGAAFASFLRPGDIISLTGDLGAGKTKFVQGLAAGLGVTEHVTSPTFAIIKEYTSGRLPFYHFDVYRLDDQRDMDGLGYEDYFFGEGVTVIEWGNKISGLLPANALTIDIKRVEPREFSFTFKDIRWQGIVEAAMR
ncbi:MAG: tRNA (adenosine(37)-N6)-threonylcarbamoyltransferase complex ATPase subunit type 1 TsaE [Actinomycetota bacterium]